MRVSRSVPYLLVFLLLLLASAGQSQQLTYLPLQLPGQASVAIDAGKQTAYVVDLGKDKVGSDFRLDDKPLLTRLDELQVKRLVVSCSHPHLDHMGGIQALFQSPEIFFLDADRTKPRFESITFIDDGVAKPLYAIFKAALKTSSALNIKYVSANGKNAFEGLSAPGDEVFIENIPYAHDTKTGAHGAAVVTRITLKHQFSVLDFDDASTPVIKKVVDNLRARGINGVDAFVVPHHGSVYHDVESILSLHPRKAIITVNPKNRYGHPSPEILTRLIEILGAENVLFTGSKAPVVLNENGVKSAMYTAADPASFDLFVEPSRMRAERRGRNKETLALYAKLETMMRPNPDAPPPAPDRVPLGPNPPVGGGGGTAADLVEADIVARRTMLSRDFEYGAIRDGGKNVAEVLQAAHLPGLPDAAYDAKRLAAVQDAEAEVSPKAIAKAALRYYMPGETPGGNQTLRVDLQYAPGLSDGLAAPLELQANDASAVATVLERSQKVPSGGMVFLDGGRLSAAGPAGRLSGGLLDLCGTQYCITSVGGDKYTVPFAPGPLFSDVWDRVVRREIPSFYLSINPTKRFLRATSETLSTIPTDRLRFGTGSLPADALNEVVTSGDIDGSIIGEILWDADVAFKSASLGFNVFTGGSGGASRLPYSISRLAVAQEDEYSTATEDRWCRLYWTSGSQKLTVDSAARKVRFEGDAVIARSEPMLRDGASLVEAPSGSWCSGSKAIALRLQRAANDPASGAAGLLQLRRLAQMQSFAKWARLNGMQETEAFRASIEKEKPKVSRKSLPTWTSGIRTNDAVYVEAETKWSTVPWSLGLHVSSADLDAAAQCVDKFYYNARETVFRKAGLEKKDGIWRYTDEQKPFFAKWITQVAQQVATCANGKVVSPGIEDVAIEEGFEEEGGINPAAYHIQPTHIHGGVLLGSDKETRKAVWLKDGRVALPDGRLVLKRDGSDLHFWAFDDKHPTFGSIGQHVVITNAKLTDIEAVAGHIRVLVGTEAGAVIRQEMRVGQSEHFLGAEWISVARSDGSVIAEKVAQLCTAAEPTEVCVSDVGLPTFGKLIGAGDNDRPLLLTQPAGTNMWLVDIDVQSVLTELDARLAKVPETDHATRYAFVGQYADWGFPERAKALQAELVDVSESEDYILAREYNPASLHEMSAGVALTLLLLVTLEDELSADLLNTIQTVEKLVLALPAEDSAPIWAALVHTCDSFASESGTRAAKLKKLRGKYSMLATRTRVLSDGVANPWDVEAPVESEESEIEGSDTLRF